MSSKEDTEYVQHHSGATEHESRFAVACHPDRPGLALYHAKAALVLKGKNSDVSLPCCGRRVK